MKFSAVRGNGSARYRELEVVHCESTRDVDLLLDIG